MFVAEALGRVAAEHATQERRRQEEQEEAEALGQCPLRRYRLPVSVAPPFYQHWRFYSWQRRLGFSQQVWRVCHE